MFPKKKEAGSQISKGREITRENEETNRDRRIPQSELVEVGENFVLHDDQLLESLTIRARYDLVREREKGGQSTRKSLEKLRRSQLTSESEFELLPEAPPVPPSLFLTLAIV